MKRTVILMQRITTVVVFQESLGPKAPKISSSNQEARNQKLMNVGPVYMGLQPLLFFETY